MAMKGETFTQAGASWACSMVWLSGPKKTAPPSPAACASAAACSPAAGAVAAASAGASVAGASVIAVPGAASAVAGSVASAWCGMPKKAFILRVVAEERAVPDHAGEHRADGEHAERDQHRARALVGVVVGVVVAARLAEEGENISRQE